MCLSQQVSHKINSQETGTARNEYLCGSDCVVRHLKAFSAGLYAASFDVKPFSFHDYHIYEKHVEKRLLLQYACVSLSFYLDRASQFTTKRSNGIHVTQDAYQKTQFERG